MHQVLFRYPLLQAMWSLLSFCVCVYNRMLNDSEHTEGRGRGMRQEHVHAQRQKNTHMRTNTKLQSAVVVKYSGIPNCFVLSVAPSALCAPNPHRHTHTCTKLPLLAEKDAYTFMHTSMFNSTNPAAHMRIKPNAYGTQTSQRGLWQPLLCPQVDVNTVLAAQP